MQREVAGYLCVSPDLGDLDVYGGKYIYIGMIMRVICEGLGVRDEGAWVVGDVCVRGYMCVWP